MKYTVDWLPHALNQLADVYNNAPDHNVITQASNEIDRQLARDPETKGTAFHSGRVLLVAPLLVTFRGDPDNLLVQVVQVKRDVLLN